MGDAIFTRRFSVNIFKPIVATGGTISNLTIGGIDYRIHAFTSVGASTFDVTDPGTDKKIEVLVVAGGGSGGDSYGGGGGAGGLIYNPNISINSQNYTITVGNGGAAIPNSSNLTWRRGNNGQNSLAFGLTAIGGGAGAGSNENSLGNGQTANTGGSGGGGAGGGSGSNQNGASGTSGQGFAGGVGKIGGTSHWGAGGGGAGEAGKNHNSGVNLDAKGGNGLYYGDKFNDNFGENGWFAGGGGGSNTSGGDESAYASRNAGLGGLGGGGRGQNRSLVSTRPAVAGQPNTGGGGGASDNRYQTPVSGGSGIVIIRYPLVKVN